MRDLRVLIVLAHPDDESLACGGTIARLARLGARVRVVSATRGEAGAMNSRVIADRRELARLRTEEFGAACATLGVTDHHVLEFRDGLLTWFDAERVIAWLAETFRDWRPHVVITFGRDGLYWHPDHIALGERVRAALARCEREVPVAAYAVVMPPGAMAAVAAHAAPAGSAPPAFWGVAPEVFGKGALKATRIVDVTDVLDVKLAAIRCHASQLDADNPLTHVTRAAAAALAVEHYHLIETSPVHGSAFDRLADPRMQD